MIASRADGIHKGSHAERHGDRAGNIQSRSACDVATWNSAQRREYRDRDDRHIDEKDRSPRPPLREHTTEHHAQRTPGRTGTAPQTHRPCAHGLVADGGHQRQRRWSQQRSRNTLHRSRGDENSCAPGTSADDARYREDTQPDEYRCSTPPQIADPPAEKHEPSEGQQVRGDDPLQTRVRESEIGTHGGQRDVDKRHVHCHKELQQEHGCHERTATLRNTTINPGRLLICHRSSSAHHSIRIHVRVRLRTST